ncbi:amidase signature domain-containing protein [Pseudomassariella vexata]|uniref:Amidase signature domain-containing protein n=1 Tax=Pseudomassariella vexata TaxID=1141098 RepID=A0A1Y2DF29_9PEZI|nr:amidase signature domain-containing protein [Pseudomassariella vexata]ORY57736.1 amidase signature domain-containing protein [Pseudomassariella vexata]
MSSTRRFANYPKAREGPATPYVSGVEKNPVLRGWPLIVGSNLIIRSTTIANLFWSNAHFGKIKDIPGLDKLQYRYEPTVIPIAEENASTQVELGPELYIRMPDDLPGRYYTVADYHEAYKTGQVTPLQVAKALLPIIRRDLTPPGKYSSAWVSSDVHRILTDAKASTERYASGKFLSIVDGVPFGVKDDTDVEGYVSHWGMAYDPKLAFFRPAKKTSESVSHILKAGGIMIGKQTQHELGSDTTGCNPRWGSPINWYNKSYYTGGSSSGAGSALGAGLVPISIGTDAGGSCRLPPSFNGVYAIKTSHGRTETMTTSVCVTSPMATNVTDLIVAYRLISQPNFDDPSQSLFSRSIPTSPPVRKFIGIYPEWFQDATPEVVDLCEKAINYLTSKCGYEVVHISIPYIREGQVAHGASCLGEAAETARMRTPNPADRFSIVNHVNKVLLAVGAQTSMLDYCKFSQLRELHMEHLAFLFQEYPGLFIMTPAAPDAGYKISPSDEEYGFSDTNMTLRSMRYAWLANWTGCPAAVAPVGYVNPEVGEGKLSVSLMAMGEWGAEEQLLSWAREVETYLNEVYPGGRIKPQDWANVLDMAKKID